MSAYTPCSVPGCDDRTSSRHRFPNPDKDRTRFNEWIDAVSNPILVDLDPNRVYRNYRVCHIHFIDNDKSTNMYLKRCAVPSQKLQSVKAVSSIHLIDKDQTDSSSNVRMSDANIEPIPSTSRTESYTASMNVISPSNALLKSVGVQRSFELSPKAKMLYERARKLQVEKYIYHRRHKELKRKLRLAERVFHISKTGLRKETVNFCLQQLLRRKSKPRGRRYTVDEKIMCLALYKTSGSGYRFLSKWFNLPSKRTLSRLLSKIPVDAGVDELLMSNLKEAAKTLRPKQKLCMLIFDEVSLMPQIIYNKYRDEIVGIVNGRIVDHALVFMIRGITKKWKQTICYTFCEGSTKPLELKNLIKELVHKLNQIGFNIIALICDQGSTNRSAVENLIKESQSYYIKSGLIPKRRIIIADKHEIIPLYDVPHLFKGIRNNLLTKHLIWETAEKSLVGKWSDIIKAYQIDSNSGDIRVIPKITEYHVIPGKIRKMKVSHVTQILSHSMAAAITIMARNAERDVTGTYTMEERASDTAKVLKFFDSLFDSLNGGTFKGTPGKPLKGAVTPHSAHIRFWEKSITSLKKMYYQKEGTTEKCVPPSLKNLINTLQLGLKYFLSRSFNQDSLENFFGQVRQHRGRHSNPTPMQFIESYKALLIRNITSVHSVTSNCEETFETSLLQLKNLLTTDIQSISQEGIVEYVPIHIMDSLTLTFERPIHKMAMGYVSGFITKKVLKKFDCNFCKIHMIKPSSYKDSQIHELTLAKEFQISDRRLTYCNEYFVICLYKTYNITKYIVSNRNITKNIKLYVYEHVKKYVHFSFMCNHKDEIINFIIDFVINLCLYNFCKSVNGLIVGKESKISNNACKLLQQAIQIQNKRKRTVK